MPRPSLRVAPDERRLLARYWKSASGFFRGASAWRAWLLVALLVSIVLLQLLVQFWLNYWNRDFFNAIEHKDSGKLWRQAIIFLPLAAASLTELWSKVGDGVDQEGGISWG